MQRGGGHRNAQGGTPTSVGKQSQLPLKPTEVEFGLQVGVEFDKNMYK